MHPESAIKGVVSCATLAVLVGRKEEEVREIIDSSLLLTILLGS